MLCYGVKIPTNACGNISEHTVWNMISVGAGRRWEGLWKNLRRGHSYLPLCFTGWAHDSALEFTAFHVAVLAISSEIFTTKGSHTGLHAKKKCKRHTHTYTQQRQKHEEKREDRNADIKSADRGHVLDRRNRHQHADKSEVQTDIRQATVIEGDQETPGFLPPRRPKPAQLDRQHRS